MSRQAGWIAAEAAVALIGTVLTTFLVSRIIGPTEVGRAALAGAIVMLAQPFVGYSFTNAMVQRAHLSDPDIVTVLWANLALACMFALPIAALGLLLPDWVGAGVGPVLAALVLMLPFNAVEGTANGLLLRRHTFRALALRGIGAQLVGLATGLSLAEAGWGAWAVVGQQLAFFGTAAILAAWFARLSPRLTLRRKTIREMAPFAITAAGSSFAARVGFRLFLLIVAGGQPALAGIMQIAFRIVETARELPSPFVHRYGLPALSRLRTDHAAFLQRLEAVCWLSGLVFAPVFAGLALCVAEVQIAILGSAWTEIVPPVQILALALTLTAFGFPLNLAFVAAGMPGVTLALTLGGLMLALLLAFLVPEGSSAGAAAAWATMLILDIVAASVLTAHLLAFQLSRQLRIFAMSLVPAIATTAAVLGVEATGLLAPLSPFALLASKVVIGAMAGVPLILLLAPSAWREATHPVLDQ